MERLIACMSARMRRDAGMKPQHECTHPTHSREALLLRLLDAVLVGLLVLVAVRTHTRQTITQ